MRELILISMIAAGLVLVACGGDETGTPGGSNTTPNSTTANNTTPNSTTANNTTPNSTTPIGEETRSTFYGSVSGGGTVAGDSVRATIGVGAPAAKGQMSGDGYRVTLGPVSP